MKRVISCVVLVAMLWMIAVPAVAVASLKAQFEWDLDRGGRLVLDASCSKGCVEEYYWEIWDDCDYLVGSGYEKIWKTQIYQCDQTKRYSVTLIVTDSREQEDSVTERVTIRKHYQERQEGIVISPRFFGGKKHRHEIHLTKGERALAWGFIFLAIIVKIIEDNN